MQAAISSPLHKFCAVTAGEWHAADMTECAKGLPWPVLDRVRMLGLPGRIDENSVTFEIMTPGKIHPLRTIPVKPSKVLHPPLIMQPSHRGTYSQDFSLGEKGHSSC